MTDYILTALSYVGYFFVACAAVVALTWFGLGLWNFGKMYYSVWAAKREYDNEKAN